MATGWLGAGRQQRPASRQHFGFTLLEVVIASVLTALLLAGLWSLLGIYSGLYEKGQSKTQHAQLVRSLQKQLADDLLSVSFAAVEKPPLPASNPSPGESNAETGTSMAPHATNTDDRSAAADQYVGSGTRNAGSGSRTTEPSPADPVASVTYQPASPDIGSTAAPQRVGLVGTQNSLVLDVIVPVDPYVYASTERIESSDAVASAPTRVPELQRISYTFHGPDLLDPASPNSGLVRRQQKWEEAYAVGSPSARQGVPQLRPSADVDVADFSPWTTVDERPVDDRRSSQTDEPRADMVDQPIDRIPEVVDFQLRYFDGFAWRSQWNSRREKSLPVAVQVQFDLKQESEPGLEVPTQETTTVSDTSDMLDPDELDSSDLDARAGSQEEGRSGYTEADLAADQLPRHRFLIYLGGKEDAGNQTAFSKFPVEGGPIP